MMSWCTVRMFDKGSLKVNIKIQGQTYCDDISSPICISLTITWHMYLGYIS